MATVENWIWFSNLKPFTEVLAHLAEYELDEDDWVAIEFGVKDTNGDIDPQVFFEYSFAGKSVVEFGLARDPGTDVLLVRASVPSELYEKFSFAVDLMNQYGFGAGT